MKKTLSCLFFLLIIFISKSQCPGCIVNTSCIVNPAEPTLCPTTLPDGYAGQPYDEDITFWMPEIFQVTQPVTQNVHLDQLKILNITGLPMGLNWQSNSTNNTYIPSPGNEHGCAKLCGTPLIPGSYNVTVFIEVTVTPQSVGGTTVVNESIVLPLLIHPNPVGNSAFNMSTSAGCAPLAVNFTPIVQSGGNPLYTYDWDFGNGDTSNLEFPPTQIYTDSGTYYVSLTTSISEYTLESVTFNVGSNTNWCGDVEEPNIFGCTGSPDLFFELRDASSTVVYTSAVIDNVMTTSWNNLNILLDNPPYSLQFWDDDPISVNDNLGIFTFSPTATGTFNFSGGGASGSRTIATQIINTLSDNDSVLVYPSPANQTVLFTPNDTVCRFNPITLWVDGGYQYQWYMNGSPVFGAIDSSYTLTQGSGYYQVQISNSFGCSFLTDSQYIHFHPTPNIPSVYQNGSNIIAVSQAPILQWYYEGQPIPGANTLTIPAAQNGYYYIMVTNTFGCTAISDSILITNAEINDLSLAEKTLKIYPVPASNVLNIDLQLQDSYYIQISVIEVSGKSVFSTQLFTNKLSAYPINLDLFESGYYILQITFNDIYILNRPLIKQ
jgi:PKD repeat protein